MTPFSPLYTVILSMIAPATSTPSGGTIAPGGDLYIAEADVFIGTVSGSATASLTIDPTAAVAGMLSAMESAMLSGVDSIFGSIDSYVTGKIATATSYVKGGVTSFLSSFGPIGSWLAGKVGPMIDWAGSWLSGKASAIIGTAESWVKSKISSIFSAVSGFILPFISSMFGKITLSFTVWFGYIFMTIKALFVEKFTFLFNYMNFLVLMELLSLFALIEMIVVIKTVGIFKLIEALIILGFMELLFIIDVFAISVSGALLLLLAGLALFMLGLSMVTVPLLVTGALLAGGLLLLLGVLAIVLLGFSYFADKISAITSKFSSFFGKKEEPKDKEPTKIVSEMAGFMYASGPMKKDKAMFEGATMFGTISSFGKGKEEKSPFSTMAEYKYYDEYLKKGPAAETGKGSGSIISPAAEIGKAPTGMIAPTAEMSKGATLDAAFYKKSEYSISDEEITGKSYTTFLAKSPAAGAYLPGVSATPAAKGPSYSVSIGGISVYVTDASATKDAIIAQVKEALNKLSKTDFAAEAGLL